ncbi:hypothetical protein J0895_03075 [Phormidium pseudopriestleyi FRX01]|uniref:Uncharacterized protein n=1 Tax=Phormidium pseudopriestleyi FRX01 TaxID=1759528 RepID=A0ABS3FM94_9CYAN|nr:hypothetical protein [Phormidium pseudopriestleyi FRX01]
MGWQVCSSEAKRIQWNVANLMNESEIERFSQSDIIFCRNVFIFPGIQFVKLLLVFIRRCPIALIYF